MQTVISAKFQTTIPKKIREQLKLSINDALDWQVDHDGKIIVEPLHKKFLLRKNSIDTGPGKIDDDIVQARTLRAERNK